MANALFDIETDYTYFNNVATNLEFAMNKRRVDEMFQGNLRDIGKNMEQIAKSLVKSNRTYKTHRLHDAIKSEPSHNSLKLFVPGDTTDSRGRYYAGHIEYGFIQVHAVGREGKAEDGPIIGMQRDVNQFKGPYPFLRPALRYGADISANRIGESFAAMISGERRWFTQKSGSDVNVLLGTNTSRFGGYTGTNRESWHGTQFDYRGGFFTSDSKGNW